MKDTINILGTEYKIIYTNYIEGDNAGKTDFVNKTIYLLNDKEQSMDVILKHEIMHAFFFESGLLVYAKDEVLVDFLALQFHKIKSLFKE